MRKNNIGTLLIARDDLKLNREFGAVSVNQRIFERRGTTAKVWGRHSEPPSSYASYIKVEWQKDGYKDTSYYHEDMFHFAKVDKDTAFEMMVKGQIDDKMYEELTR